MSNLKQLHTYSIYPRKDFYTPYNRILAFQDYIHHRSQPYDDAGHGTHISGIIGAHSKEETSSQRYIGIAPLSSLIVLKVLDSSGNGTTEDFIAALHWISKYKEHYNIRIVNISMGTLPQSTGTNDDSYTIEQEVEKLWDLGLVVCTAAGNNGPRSNTITSPGTSRKVITVGSYDTTQATNFAVSSPQIEHRNYSGRGPTNNCIMKPEILAPGSQILSYANHPNKLTYKSGTSMATPMVSASIALLLEKYPKLTNSEVKICLRNSATDVSLPRNQQGWGLLNIPSLFWAASQTK